MIYLFLVITIAVQFHLANGLTNADTERNLIELRRDVSQSFTARTHDNDLRRLVSRGLHGFAGMMRASDARRASRSPLPKTDSRKPQSDPRSEPSSPRSPRNLLLDSERSLMGGGSSPQHSEHRPSPTTSPSSQSAFGSTRGHYSGSTQSLLQESPSRFRPSRDVSRDGSRSPSPGESTKAHGISSVRSSIQGSTPGGHSSEEPRHGTPEPSPGSSPVPADVTRLGTGQGNRSNRSLARTSSSLVGYMSAYGSSRSSSKTGSSSSDVDAMRSGSFSKHSSFKESSSRETPTPPTPHSPPPPPPPPITSIEEQSPRRPPPRPLGLHDSPGSVGSGRWPRTMQIIPGAEIHSPVHSMHGEQGSTPPNSPSASIEYPVGPAAGLGDSPGSNAESTQAHPGSPMSPYDLLRIRTRRRRHWS